MTHPILLYDGVCGLCNRFVQFILRRDSRKIFRFASLQSAFAAPVLKRHGKDPADLDTMYVVLNHDETEETLLVRSDAVLFVLRLLRGVWGFAAFVFKLVPRAIRDWAYGVVVRNRYPVFGKYDSCPLPSPETRSRFLDQ